MRIVKPLRSPAKEGFHPVTGRGGFTLVELLAALAISGFIISAIYTLYFTGLNSWNRTTGQMDGRQNTHIAMDIMVRELLYAEAVTIFTPDQIRFHLPGDSRTYLFRKAGQEIVYERVSPYFHNKVALGISALNFAIDGTHTVTITITAVEEHGAVTLTGAVRPRNIR